MPADTARIVNKGGSWAASYEHAARALISSKMATGSWQKWYDGSWAQPSVGGQESNVVPISADSAAPASPVDASKVYRIGSARRLLSQVSGSTSTTSVRSDNGLAAWRFGAVGDGSYTITNASTGQLLGVPATSASTRTWGNRPTATVAVTGNAKVGQQWFVVPNTSAKNGQATGTVRLVNRYSGLVLAVSADKSRAAETTPGRSWTDTSGSTVGDGRTAAQQTLRLTSVGAASYTPTLHFVTPKSGHKVAGTTPVTVKLGGAALQA